MKKLISLFLVLAIACGFCVVSFADGTESTGSTTAEVEEIGLETRQADPIINSAIEAIEALNEINTETNNTKTRSVPIVSARLDNSMLTI